MVPACSSSALTNVLPHENAMSQTQELTPHPVTVYRQMTDLSLCYPLIWNVCYVPLGPAFRFVRSDFYRSNVSVCGHFGTTATFHCVHRSIMSAVFLSFHCVRMRHVHVIYTFLKTPIEHKD